MSAQRTYRARSADGLREGEIAVELPERFDASLYFIGRIRTPWQRREDCPKNPRETDAACTIVLDPRWVEGLKGLETVSHVVVLYWMDQARRDLVLQIAASLCRAARHLCAALAGAAQSDRGCRSRGLSASKATSSLSSGSIASTARRCSTSSRILRRPTRCPTLASAGTRPKRNRPIVSHLKQRRHLAEPDHAEKDRAVGEAQRQTIAGLPSIAVGWPIFLRLSITLALALLRIAPLSPGTSRSSAEAPCAAAPLEPASRSMPCAINSIDAEMRHDALDADDGDADEAVELAVSVDVNCAGADDDDVACAHAQRFDLDAAAGGLASRGNDRPTVWAPDP